MLINWVREFGWYASQMLGSCCSREGRLHNTTAGEQGEATAGPAGRKTKEGLGDWEPTGQNLPAIPRRIAEKIRRGQYVDFSALPPAAGLSKQPLEGGLVVYKAEDLARSSKIIPDIAMLSVDDSSTQGRPEQTAGATVVRLPHHQLQ